MRVEGRTNCQPDEVRLFTVCSHQPYATIPDFKSQCLFLFYSVFLCPSQTTQATAAVVKWFRCHTGFPSATHSLRLLYQRHAPAGRSDDQRAPAGYRIARLTALWGGVRFGGNAPVRGFGALSRSPPRVSPLEPDKGLPPLTQIFMLRQALTGACLVVSERRPVTVSLALPPLGRVRLLWRQCSGTGLWGFTPIPTKGFTLGT